MIRLLITLEVFFKLKMIKIEAIKSEKAVIVLRVASLQAAIKIIKMTFTMIPYLNKM